MTVAKRNKRAQADAELMQLADSLLANDQKPEDLIGENGLLKQLTKMLVERALEAEMTSHLGHGKSGAVTNDSANTRNGHTPRRSKAISARCRWPFPAIARGRLNPYGQNIDPAQAAS